MNYKMTIAYDGARYKGWQRLGDSDNTIQGKIESVLGKLFKTEIEIIGSSRTDAGVHASCQVASFSVKSNKPTEEVKNYLNKYLPDDIVIKDVEEVDSRFHARFNCTSKTYKYTIWTSKVGDPFQRKYYFHYTDYLDLELMERAAEQLIGKHDFTSFTNAKSKKKSMERNVMDIKIDGDLDKLEIYITADGFLHNMVRKIVGLLIDVGSSNRPLSDVKTMLKSKDRANSSFIAPSQGLCLMETNY